MKTALVKYRAASLWRQRRYFSGSREHCHWLRCSPSLPLVLPLAKRLPFELPLWPDSPVPVRAKHYEYSNQHAADLESFVGLEPSAELEMCSAKLVAKLWELQLVLVVVALRAAEMQLSVVLQQVEQAVALMA